MSSQLTVLAVKKSEDITEKEPTKDYLMVDWWSTTPTRELQSEGLIEYTPDNDILLDENQINDIINFYKDKINSLKKLKYKTQKDLRYLKKNLCRANCEEVYNKMQDDIDVNSDCIQETETEIHSLESNIARWSFILEMINNNESFNFYYNAD